MFLGVAAAGGPVLGQGWESGRGIGTGNEA